MGEPVARRLTAVVLVVGALVLVGCGGQKRASTRVPSTRSSAPASTASREDEVVVGGDLGDVSDVRVLAAVVGPALPAPGATTSSTRRSGPRVVGTRPCEMEARDRGPGVGPVVYQATGRAGGDPAVVLGFASPSGGRPVILEVLARDGCRLLASTTVP